MPDAFQSLVDTEENVDLKFHIAACRPLRLDCDKRVANCTG